MEMTSGRLSAILAAGRILVTQEALATLRAGLTVIGWDYFLARFASKKIKTDADLEKDLSRLYPACGTIIDLLENDMSGGCQIEAMLSDAWHGNPLPGLIRELRLLISKIETALAVAAQGRTLKKRTQNSETRLFLATYDLFCEITGNDEPGIAGPLHRFTKQCAALIDSNIVVPETENSFQKRLPAALARRTGKINVLPIVLFSGKIAAPPQ